MTNYTKPCTRKGCAGTMYLKQNPEGRIWTCDTCEQMDPDKD